MAFTSPNEEIGQQILEISTEDDGGVVASLETKLLQREHFISRKNWIFKIPARIRELDEKTFIPKAVSIGPLHRKKLEHYEAMEKYKVHYLKQFLDRNPSKTLTDCVKMLKELEEEARGCYAVDICLKSDEFVEMMMLDGCFIIECFLMSWKPAELRYPHSHHPLLNHTYMITVCEEDLMLVENQLPYFVLDALFDFINTSDSGKLWEISFLGLAFIFYGWNADASNISPECKPIHLLDILYREYITRIPKSKPVSMDRIPRTTQLQGQKTDAF
ncbi:hypothetical protein Sjap_003102 [Stephania japonica]|uniref:Uncharacterized protein n=1 Tax=Stephania japonica TaxID=461633 RepID=A0AAP0KN35_9MAGN